MSELVNPNEIEKIVGVQRHPTLHYGRASSSDQTVYILHSEECKIKMDDLRDCDFSRAMDNGIQQDTWDGYIDRPVVLAIVGFELVPSQETDA